MRWHEMSASEISAEFDKVRSEVRTEVQRIEVERDRWKKIAERQYNAIVLVMPHIYATVSNPVRGQDLLEAIDEYERAVRGE